MGDTLIYHWTATTHTGYIYTSLDTPSQLIHRIYSAILTMSTTTELYSGIGKRNSSKVTAPPGGKSSIGIGGDDPVEKVQPKNSASAAKARDLSTNPLEPVVEPSVCSTSDPPNKEKESVSEVTPPRPKGAPNRAIAPPGGHSQGSFWCSA